MKLNKTFAYALRATLVLGKCYDGPFVSSKKVAAESGVSGKYLLCVLALLSRHGIVVSTRGFKGGFRLARSPEELSLLDIATACGELADETDRLDDFPESVAAFMRESLRQLTQNLSAELDSLKISDVLKHAPSNASLQTATSELLQDHAALVTCAKKLGPPVEVNSLRPEELPRKRESA